MNNFTIEIVFDYKYIVFYNCCSGFVLCCFFFLGKLGVNVIFGVFLVVCKVGVVKKVRKNL